MDTEPILMLAAWSYGIAAAGFLAFLVQLVLGWEGGRRAWRLLAAVAASAVWAGAIVASVLSLSRIGFALVSLADAARTTLWLAFVGALLAGDHGNANGPRRPGLVATSFSALIAFLVVGRMGILAPVVRTWVQAPQQISFVAGLGLSICGLVLLEQLYRRTPETSRWAIRPLCLGLAVGFGYELVLYADAMLFSRIDPDLWAASGIVHALGVPFIAVATARNKQWTVDVSVSRGVIAFSISLLASGIYLLLAAGAGYYLKYFGGSWGRALQAAFLAGAALLFVALALSGSARARIKVLVSKHFFSYRFDYREEWLKFTRTLSSRDPGTSVYVLCIKALADLVESPAGQLWIRRDQRFVPIARWNLAAAPDEAGLSGDVPAFLARTGWIVDVPECRDDPGKYDGLSLPDALVSVPDAWLLVPLMSASELAGVVLLTRPRAKISLDWEVRDALKTAGRQAATYLVQAEATAALLEAEKFDAFNRMSAFVVHDLRNLVSQLTLLLKNAERHYQNPEFQKDMLETVRNVVARMSDLLLQLRTGATPVDSARPVELSAVVTRIRDAKSLQGRNLAVESSPNVLALGHDDRLEHVIGHIVQNSLDATTRDGHVLVRVCARGRDAVVEVEDDGVGMSEQFICNDLFRPFHTTKPQGMGIGMYESRQYIEKLGGKIEVESSPGVGTTVRVLLPQHVPGVSSPTDLQEVA